MLCVHPIQVNHDERTTSVSLNLEIYQTTLLLRHHVPGSPWTGQSAQAGVFRCDLPNTEWVSGAGYPANRDDPGRPAQ